MKTDNLRMFAFSYVRVTFVPVTLTLIRWPWYELDLHILKAYVRGPATLAELPPMNRETTDERIVYDRNTESG